MDKNAWVLWQGGIKDGCGSMSKEVGVPKETPYGINASCKNGNGTNTDELIGVAPAVCFSMAQTLGEAGGVSAKTIATQAAVTLNKVGDGYEITISLFRSVPKRPLSLVSPK